MPASGQQRGARCAPMSDEGDAQRQSVTGACPAAPSADQAGTAWRHGSCQNLRRLPCSCYYDLGDGISSTPYAAMELHSVRDALTAQRQIPYIATRRVTTRAVHRDSRQALRQLRLLLPQRRLYQRFRSALQARDSSSVSCSAWRPIRCSCWSSGPRRPIGRSSSDPWTRCRRAIVCRCAEPSLVASITRSSKARETLA